MSVICRIYLTWAFGAVGMLMLGFGIGADNNIMLWLGYGMSVVGGGLLGDAMSRVRKMGL